LGDVDRARGIYELAVQQALDMPELVWKVSLELKALVRATLIRFDITGIH